MKLFTRYVQKALSACALFAAALFVGCSGVHIADGEQTAGGSVAADDALVTVRVAVDSIARTALPQFEKEDFTTFKLTWTNSTVSQLKQWIPNENSLQSAYQMMNEDSFTLPAGTYTFTLTGTDAHGAIYRGTLADTAVTADSIITFTLELARVSSSGSGTLSLDVSYPTENVTKMTVTRYASTDEAHYASASSTAMATYTSSSELTGSYTYNESVSAGAYIIEFAFFGGASRDQRLGTWLEYAYVTSGKTSAATVTIDSLDSLYAISYSGADDATFTTKPLYFTTNQDITLPVPAKEGYTFTGWYEAVDEDGAPVGTALTGWNKGERHTDITLYATWRVSTYTVSFATGDENVSVDSQTISHGECASAPETAPERTGFTFAGWYTDSTYAAEFDFENTQITQAVTVYARWSYTVAFSANTETATGSMQSVSRFADDTSSLTLAENAFVYTGNTFLGWALSADATAAAYGDGGVVPASAFASGNTTFYAVWHSNTDTTKLTVRFDSTGGTGVASQLLTSGTAASEPADPVREGYVFLGWHTSSDDGATLSAAAYNFAALVMDDLVLYANWAQTSWYVSPDGSNSTGAGTVTSPYASVAQAVSRIQTIGSSSYDYTIVVSGEVSECVSITSSNLTTSHARSLTIRGATGNSTDKLNGSANGTVLTLSTSVPVTLADIALTNGTATGEYGAGGVKLNGSTLTLEDGALITGNKATGGWNRRGIGVYISSGALVMKDGASISDNNVNSGSCGDRGGGVYIDSGASFTMDGGLISGNVLPDYDEGDGGAGVFVVGTFIMNGGEISGNRLTSGNTNSYYGGAGVMVSGGTFTMTGGIIANNVCNGGRGGAVFVYNGTFNMSGSAYIPYGGAIRNNDVYLRSGKYITVAGELAAPDDGSSWASPIATITPYATSAGARILTAASGVTLTEDIANLFALTSAVSSSLHIGAEGTLISGSSGSSGSTDTPVTGSITYKDRLDRDFTGTFDSDPLSSYTAGSTAALPVPQKEGFVFLGWFTTADCSGLAVSTLSGQSGDLVLYAWWAEPTVSVRVDNGDISITQTADTESGTITLTAASGFTGYSWTVDGAAPETLLTGATVSESGNALTITTASLHDGHVYTVRVVAANKNGVPYSTNILIQK